MLQIYNRRERALVTAADLGLRLARPLAHWSAHRTRRGLRRRILVLRLERIGDLLMTLDAIAGLRTAAPGAQIDLVVGSWNAPIAALLPWVDSVETLDAPWLARGAAHARWREMAARALEWRARRYDAAVNLEPDIRTNLLLAVTGAPVRAGFESAGGGPALTVALPHDPSEHTATNARRLVDAVVAALRMASTARAPDDAVSQCPHSPDTTAHVRLPVPEDARARAASLLGTVLPANTPAPTSPATPRDASARPLIGLHVNGGRAIKQWHPSRFGAAVSRLARERGAAIVLTGSDGDASLVAEARSAMADDVPIADLSGRADLVTLAAVLERLTVFVSGDTGPMHLAAAVGTPVVAVFGPSTPSRYAPLTPHRRIVRIDLPCSPCNRIRLPPGRCQGHVPDCLEGISADMVYRAAADLLNETERSLDWL